MSVLTFTTVEIIRARVGPLNDRGNMVERKYVSTYQDGELLELEPTECSAFTVCTPCQKCGLMEVL